MQLSNKANLPFAIALWCANDTYSFKPNARSISGTSLIKPTRQILLSRKFPEEVQNTDLIDRIAAKRGTAIHDSIEKALLNTEARNAMLKEFGWSDEKISRVVINPDEITPNTIPMYVEKRFSTKITDSFNEEWTLSGQFDLVIDGKLHDFKTTSVYTYINDSKKDDYILQGSIYKYIAPDVVQSDTIAINYIFTDWNRNKVDSVENYPKYPVVVKEYPLLHEEDIKDIIISKLDEIDNNERLGLLPRCEVKDLWFPDPVYKYYSEAGKKCLKRFDNLEDANAHVAAKGKGFIVTEKASPKRCLYCSCFDVCSQKDEYFPEGKPE